MSKVHLSKAYAILVGLEGFLSTKAAVHSGLEGVFKPKRARMKREEKRKDLNRELEKEANKTRGDAPAIDDLSKIATELKKLANLDGHGDEIENAALPARQGDQPPKTSHARL